MELLDYIKILDAKLGLSLISLDRKVLYGPDIAARVYISFNI